MKKRVMLLLGIVLALVLALTACGSEENTEQPKNDVANENLQEEIPAFDEGLTEIEVEPTQASTPTPTPTQAVKVERLLLGLGEYMKEYGSAELDMGMTVLLNMTDAEIEELKQSEIFENIEITSEFKLNATGLLTSSKDSSGIQLNIENNEFGYPWSRKVEQYLQLNENGEMMNYFFDEYEGTWYVYNEGEATPLDLTEWAESIGVINCRQLATKTVYQELELTEDVDKYLIDGSINFERFRMFASIANIFIPDIMNTLPNDLEIKIHMEFGKDDLGIRVMSIYLDNMRPMTQNDRMQFSEFYIDIKFDITPNGTRVQIPAYIIDSAVSAN